jgi:hypothetical protein
VQQNSRLLTIVLFLCKSLLDFTLKIDSSGLGILDYEAARFWLLHVAFRRAFGQGKSLHRLGLSLLDGEDRLPTSAI